MWITYTVAIVIYTLLGGVALVWLDNLWPSRRPKLLFYAAVLVCGPIGWLAILVGLLERRII